MSKYFLTRANVVVEVRTRSFDKKVEIVVETNDGSWVAIGVGINYLEAVRSIPVVTMKSITGGNVKLNLTPLKVH